MRSVGDRLCHAPLSGVASRTSSPHHRCAMTTLLGAAARGPFGAGWFRATVARARLVSFGDGSQSIDSQIAVTTSATALSAVVVEAYKKLLLCSLVLKGTKPILPK